jgi:hypothetical protein
MRINELEDPDKIDPLQLSEENQEFMLKALPPLAARISERRKQMRLFGRLLEKAIAEGKTEDEFIEIAKQHGLN